MFLHDNASRVPSEHVKEVDEQMPCKKNAHENEVRNTFYVLCHRCQIGYIGSRCEYLNLEVQIQAKQRIIITCAIAGLVLLILLVVFICICSR